jgi:hypothetical protein
MVKEVGLYANDLGGIVNLFWLIGMFQIVVYCREHDLVPNFITDDQFTQDGGEVIFCQ